MIEIWDEILYLARTDRSLPICLAALALRVFELGERKQNEITCKGCDYRRWRCRV